MNPAQVGRVAPRVIRPRAKRRSVGLWPAGGAGVPPRHLPFTTAQPGNAVESTSARNEYDDAGRLVRQIDAAGNTNSFIHDIDARAEIIRDRLGNITIHEYDKNGNITRTVDALNNVTLMTYDANDNMLTN